jgi:subtilisin family serine protease
MDATNLGRSIAMHGLRAPGEGITSLDSNGERVISGGTSAATPFVTGAIALLWSLFPGATAARIKLSITRNAADRGNSVVPPLLDAWTAYQSMAGSAL